MPKPKIAAEAHVHKNNKKIYKEFVQQHLPLQQPGSVD